MNPNALALVVTGALLHAVWNFFAKKASGGLPFVWLFGIVSLMVAVPFGVFSWCADPQPLSIQAWSAIAGSALVHVAYSLVLQKGYQKSDFSIVYPLARGTGPLFAVLGAIIVLGEAPSPAGWLGIFSVLTGILLISGVVQAVYVLSVRARTGILWGMMTGITIAAYTVIDGWAIQSLGLAPLLYYALGFTLRTIILAPFALRDPHALLIQWRLNRRYIFTVGVLSPVAYTLVLFALTMAPLSYVAPVRELSMLIGMIFGARLLREAFIPSRIIGTVFMVAGVILLAMV